MHELEIDVGILFYFYNCPIMQWEKWISGTQSHFDIEISGWEVCGWMTGLVGGRCVVG